MIATVVNATKTKLAKPGDQKPFFLKFIYKNSGIKMKRHSYGLKD